MDFMGGDTGPGGTMGAMPRTLRVPPQLMKGPPTLRDNAPMVPGCPAWGPELGRGPPLQRESYSPHALSGHAAGAVQEPPCDPKPPASVLQELYKNIAWPLYRIFGHAFDAFKVTVSDEGEAIFNRLVEDRGAPIEVLTPEVSGEEGGRCRGGEGGRGESADCVWRIGMLMPPHSPSPPHTHRTPHPSLRSRRPC